MSSISRETVREISSDAIRKELLENFEKNIVYVHRAAILCEVEKVLKSEEIGSAEEVNATDILLTLDAQTIYNHTSHLSEEAMQGVNGPGALNRRTFWNHLVALLFMKQLKNKYPVENAHLGLLDEEEAYFTEKTIKDYLDDESILVTREDVFETIKNLDLPRPVRVHIVLKATSYGLDDEISYYLQDKPQFPTFVYTTGGRVGYIETWDEDNHFRIETRQFKYYDHGELIEDTHPKTAKAKRGKKQD